MAVHVRAVDAAASDVQENKTAMMARNADNDRNVFISPHFSDDEPLRSIRRPTLSRTADSRLGSPGRALQDDPAPLGQRAHRDSFSGSGRST